MPTAYIKKIADKKGISVDKAESYWEKAKAAAKKNGHEGEYDYITGIFKRMIGESLTFAELQAIDESLLQSPLIPAGMKEFILKNFNSKVLNAAVSQYVKFRKEGMKDHEAKHKAAGMYGIDSDKVFSDLIHKLQKKGLIEGKYERAFLMFIEEGEPTNVSGDVDKIDKPLFKKEKKKDKKEKNSAIMKSESWKAFKSRMFEAIGMKMNAAAKRKASNAISKYISKNYFSTPADPVSAADDALRAVGYRLVQEDGTDFSAIFTGREGRSTIRISPVDAPDDPKSMVTNTMLAVQWYKMDKSSKYEVNMYLS